MHCSLNWGGIKTFAGFEVNEQTVRVYDIEVKFTQDDFFRYDLIGEYACWNVNECKYTGEREGWID